jgi:hypothetical protein
MKVLKFQQNKRSRIISTAFAYTSIVIYCITKIYLCNVFTPQGTLHGTGIIAKKIGKKIFFILESGIVDLYRKLYLFSFLHKRGGSEFLQFIKMDR